MNIELLKELVNLNGAPGYEDEVRKYIEKQIENCYETKKVDPLGNLIVFKKGKQRRTTPFVVSTRLDEAAMVVTSITEDGYLKVAKTANIDPRTIIGKTLFVGTDKVRGIISLKAIHLTTDEEEEHAPELKSLFVDIGASGKGEAEGKVQVGDPVYFENNYLEFGNDLIRAKSIDDRIGCAVLIDIIKGEIEYDTYFTFTAQSLVLYRGASVVTNSINPSHAMVIDGCVANDLPTVPDHKKVTCLGKGVGINLHDYRSIYTADFRKQIQEIAKQNGIATQCYTNPSSANEAGYLHIKNGGCKIACISLPTRYIKSHNCVANKNDMHALHKLTLAIVNSEVK